MKYVILYYLLFQIFVSPIYFLKYCKQYIFDKTDFIGIIIFPFLIIVVLISDFKEVVSDIKDMVPEAYNWMFYGFWKEQKKLRKYFKKQTLYYSEYDLPSIKSPYIVEKYTLKGVKLKNLERNNSHTTFCTDYRTLGDIYKFV